MTYSKDLLYKLHRLSFGNEPLMGKATVCGCFYCGAIYSPDVIDPEMDYCIDFPHSTALCHYCGIDSVILDNMGVEITPELLGEMYQEFFENTAEEEDGPFSGTELEVPDDRLQRVQFPCNGASGEPNEVCAVTFKDGSRAALKEAPFVAALGLESIEGVNVAQGFPSGTTIAMYVTMPDRTARIVTWNYENNGLTVQDAEKTPS